jgi:hypothetical protein
MVVACMEFGQVSGFFCLENKQNYRKISNSAINMFLAVFIQIYELCELN